MDSDDVEPPPADGGASRPHGVFLSYSRSDRDKALRIVAALEKAGFSVWWDGLLEGGERFAETTKAALDGARAVVVLWSKTSVGSHWVHDEATRGRDTRRLVPLSIDGAEPPLGFGQFQCIDVSHGLRDPASPAMQAMVRAVGALHDNPPAARPPAPPPRAGLAIGRRGVLAGGAAAALAGSGLIAWKAGLFAPGSKPGSIAVLPFANLSGDPEQAYFSDGLTTEIRSELSRNALLQVVGQTSSNQFRDREEDAKTIAATLGVAYLLEGNVQKAGEIVKIATDLTDGRTGLSAWSRSFERPLTDVFTVQEEIADAVASALSVAMDAGAAREDMAETGGTKSVAAFDAYLRGRDIFELHRDDDSYLKALAKFDEAIGIDPDYAAARAARSRTLGVIGNQATDTRERKSLYDDCVREAERAIAIAPQFAAGFNALGSALFYGRLDVRGAAKPFEQAYALAKSDVEVFSRYAVYSARIGRFAQAETAIQRAVALDPLNASVFKSSGNIHYAAGRYEQAITFGRKALELNPERSTVRGDIGNALIMMGELDKARAEFEAETSELISLPGLAIVAARKGDDAEVGRLLEVTAERHGDNGLYQQAQILAQWGKPDAALDRLARARAATDSGLVYLLNDPFLEPLRKTAGYRDLLGELGFV